jgi:inosine-uridine nucleoside N-ribohydrolase
MLTGLKRLNILGFRKYVKRPGYLIRRENVKISFSYFFKYTLGIVCLFALNQLSFGSLPPLPRDAVFMHDTDIGNDIDDTWAVGTATLEAGKNIVLGTTTIYRPDEKARILKLTYSQLGCPDIPVSSGYGFYEDGSQSFRELYPWWPEKFGIPGSTNKVSLLQGKAYAKLFAKHALSPFALKTAADAIIGAAATYKDRLVVISQAPFSNIAQAFMKKPDIMSKINRIVAMSGWFGDPIGTIERLGYNMSIDLESARIVLEQKTVPVFIVSSQLGKSFVMQESERASLVDLPDKSEFGQAVCDDMQLYWENKVPARSPLGMVDVITNHIAIHPEVVERALPVRLKFDEEVVARHLDMFNKEASRSLTVTPEQTSNIHIVTQVKDQEDVRKKLIGSIKAILTRKSS